MVCPSVVLPAEAKLLLEDRLQVRTVLLQERGRDALPHFGVESAGCQRGYHARGEVGRLVRDDRQKKFGCLQHRGSAQIDQQRVANLERDRLLVPEVLEDFDGVRVVRLRQRAGCLELDVFVGRF